MAQVPRSMLDLIHPTQPLVASMGHASSNVHVQFFDMNDSSSNAYTIGLSNNSFFVTKENSTTGPIVLNGNAQINSLGVGAVASGTVGEIRATNDITAFYSDSRLKKDITEIPNALEKLEKIRGVYYVQSDLASTFGFNKTERQVGVIAQEVQAVLPEVIKIAPFDMKEDGTSASGNDYLTVQYDRIIPLLVQAIKEQNKRIDALEAKLQL